MPDPSQTQVPTATVPAAQAVLGNSSADTASSAEAPSTVASQETLEVNIFSLLVALSSFLSLPCFSRLPVPFSSLVSYLQFFVAFLFPTRWLIFCPLRFIVRSFFAFS